MRKKPLVFVVDDDALIRNNLERYLSQSGWEVKAISDGFEVLLLCMYLIPDLIISDMRMPKLDGITLLQGLHNNEQTKKIPVILMSAFATDELMEKAKDLGAEFFLIKPFTLFYLGWVINRALPNLLEWDLPRKEDPAP